MDTTRIRILKIVWVTLALVILAWTLVDYYGATIDQLKFEIGLRHLILISVICFPLGPVLLLVVVRVFGIKFPGVYEIFEVWILSFVGGYYQWFKLLPYLLDRRRTAKSKHAKLE